MRTAIMSFAACSPSDGVQDQLEPFESRPLATDPDRQLAACRAGRPARNRSIEEIQPKRWLVERPIARLKRRRRLARDWENLNQTALAFLRLAALRFLLRRLSNPT